MARHMESTWSAGLLVANLSSQGEILFNGAESSCNHYLLRISDMMQKSTKVLEPFTTGSWTWNSDNLLNLEVKKSLTLQFHIYDEFFIFVSIFQQKRKSVADIFVESGRPYCFANFLSWHKAGLVGTKYKSGQVLFNDAMLDSKHTWFKGLVLLWSSLD